MSHPHAAAVACAAAAALQDHEQLAGFFTGVAASKGSRRARILGLLAKRRGELSNRIVAGVSEDRLTSLAGVELTARLMGNFARVLVPQRAKPYDAMFALHDWAVSLIEWPSGTDAVYAYEDGALRTFRRAARQGVMRIWDLPTPHWATVERTWREEYRRWPGAMRIGAHEEPSWKKARKQGELDLCDAVAVASRFTRESMESVGVRKAILVLPYGFPVESFEPKTGSQGGPFTVLSVGMHDLRKGTQYLLEAWKQAGLRDARLRLVGPMRLTDEFLAPYRDLFEHVPHVPRLQMGRYYRDADLLAFPTLADGFGLVIQEAMCCATPVLTTPCSGGPECIEDGAEGWLVPARDVDALVDRLREASQGRDRLIEMGRAARARAEQRTWKEAGDELATVLGQNKTAWASRPVVHGRLRS